MRTVLLLTSALWLSATAQAQDDSVVRYGPDGKKTTITWGPAPALPDQGNPDFDALDRDGDDRLTLVETEAHRLLHSDFKFADSNRDGTLSRRELQRWIESDG
ncbi:MAG: hypothetical protein KDI37_17705 [Xanthomonadales bacterium]|nr:hypothetical protein [Xanthomonadales bacterium]MCB1643571.1 hypothetical protein [Xanthomonadales bacterium]